MIALDTNILVYARRKESVHHRGAVSLLKQLAEGDEPWAVPWPCIYEFLRVVTHPRIFDPPTELDAALDELESLFESPSLVLLREGPNHVDHMLENLDAGHATGNLVYDARIAALCIEHGVRELLTTDRDFARFPGLVFRNPFDEMTVHERRGRYRTRSRRTRAVRR